MAAKSFKEFLDEIRAAYDHQYDPDGVRIEIRTREGVQYQLAGPPILEVEGFVTLPFHDEARRGQAGREHASASGRTAHPAVTLRRDDIAAIEIFVAKRDDPVGFAPQSEPIGRRPKG